MLTLCTLLYLLIACSASEIETEVANGTVTTDSQPVTDMSVATVTSTSRTDSEDTSTTTTTVASAVATASAHRVHNFYDAVVPILEKCKSTVEVYSKCANSCPASCEDLERKPCRNFCWSGCECASGHVRNHRWRCIAAADCPKCGENEHYRNCGSNCEPTCENYQNMPVACNTRASCKRGCFCDYGYVRDAARNGTCVKIDQCPQKCGPNEYWDPNGRPCIRTAERPRPSCLFEESKASCVCNTGYRRDEATGQCLLISDLVDTKCAGNETFSYCGSECAMNCFDESRRVMCPTICHRGCFCKEGYRRENSGRCVLPADCQMWTGPSQTDVLFS